MNSQKPKLILCVDDEVEICDLYADILQGEGYQTKSAYSGNEALNILERSSGINLVISDILMPNGTGIELLEGMNQKQIEVPLIFITGQSPLTETEAAKMGAIGYFSKPLNFDTLCAFIDHQLTRPDQTLNLQKPSLPEKIRVLQAEDSDQDYELLKLAIEESEFADRITLERYNDGEQFLSALETATKSNHPPPDIVILDLKMPKVDGLQALEGLRKIDALKSVPVIMLTGSNAPSDRQSAQRLGANSYFTKPSEFLAWQHMVNSWTQSWIKSKP